MIAFNPWWGGIDIVQDTPPYDRLSIDYVPSIANDQTAASGQMMYMESTKSFMQTQFRQIAENMRDAGLIYSSAV